MTHLVTHYALFDTHCGRCVKVSVSSTAKLEELKQQQPPPGVPTPTATPAQGTLPPQATGGSPQQQAGDSQATDGKPMDQQVAPMENGMSDSSVNGVDEEMETDEKEEVKEEVGLTGFSGVVTLWLMDRPNLFMLGSSTFMRIVLSYSQQIV